MHNHGITCRIRESKGNYEATIKDHSKFFSECSVENICYSGTQYDDTFFRRMGLILQGCLQTERFVCKMPNVKIMFDKNTYLDIIDYELEIEYEPRFENKAVEIMNYIAESLELGGCINSASEFFMRVKQLSKSSRFFIQNIKVGEINE